MCWKYLVPDMGGQRNLRRWLLVGIMAEGLLLLGCYFAYPEPGEAFRHAARYSGRLSLLLFLVAFGVFAVSRWKRDTATPPTLHHLVIVFAVLHFIHLGFVAMNVRLNAIELVPYKLAGGALAYALVLAYPIMIHRVKARSFLHPFYFNYVGVVMAITYVERLNGEFDGAPPDGFHLLGLGLMVAAFTVGTALLTLGRGVDADAGRGRIRNPKGDG